MFQHKEIATAGQEDYESKVYLEYAGMIDEKAVTRGAPGSWSLCI